MESAVKQVGECIAYMALFLSVIGAFAAVLKVLSVL